MGYAVGGTGTLRWNPAKVNPALAGRVWVKKAGQMVLV